VNRKDSVVWVPGQPKEAGPQVDFHCWAHAVIEVNMTASCYVTPFHCKKDPLCLIVSALVLLPPPLPFSPINSPPQFPPSLPSGPPDSTLLPSRTARPHRRRRDATTRGPAGRPAVRPPRSSLGVGVVLCLGDCVFLSHFPPSVPTSQA
jgi:hypothetical protein